MPHFYVDFSSWEIEAENQKEAENKALEQIRNGWVPLISNTDEMNPGERACDNFLLDAWKPMEEKQNESKNTRE